MIFLFGRGGVPNETKGMINLNLNVAIDPNML